MFLFTASNSLSLSGGLEVGFIKPKDGEEGSEKYRMRRWGVYDVREVERPLRHLRSRWKVNARWIIFYKMTLAAAITKELKEKKRKILLGHFCATTQELN